MIRSPKVYSVGLLVLLALLLIGCELRRDSGDGTDAEPVGDLSPTLAPLGTDSSELTGGVPPTVILVEPTASPSALEAGATANEITEPTSQPAVDLSSESTASDSVQGQAAAEPESFVLPEDDAATVEEITLGETTQEASAEQAAESTTNQEVTVEEAALEEPVIANAPEDLPTGGPIAANPPASDTFGSSAAVPTEGTHVVQPGDTLFNISQRYGTTVQALIAANGLTSDVIREGQVLNISGGTGYGNDYAASPYPSNNIPASPNAIPDNAVPYMKGTHIVAPGETLFSIAQRYGTSVEVVASANGIPYPYTIYAGQTLNIAGYPGNNFAQPNPYAQPGNAPYEQNPYAQPGNNPYAQPNDNSAFVNPDGFATHIVAPGETLFSIAQLYGLTPESLAAANGLANPNQIAVGQVLYLP